ncbi:ccr4 associated factor [Coemansia nantahalensis]|nr:ccr4 associated factor [Coemansia nantahalensis]
MALARLTLARAAARRGQQQQQRWLGRAAIRVGRAAELETALDGADQCAAVEGRAVLEVGGADATEFLNGMQCNDMARIAGGGGGMLTAFLTAQGRVVADAFMYPQPAASAGASGSPRYLVEVDARVAPRILQILSFYRLRSRVEIRDATDEYAVWSLWGPRAATAAAAAQDGAWAADGRAPGMGLRLVAERSGVPRAVAGLEQRGADEYRLRRILKGVAEGADDFVCGAAVPLECNLDYMGGVHFSKGCYVGQELTIRTHHRGVVRKRLVPVLLAHADAGPRNPLCVDRQWACPVPPQAEITRTGGAPPPSARRVQPGRLGSTAWNAGLALMRLDLVQQYVAGDDVAFEATAADGSRVFVSPWLPSWWPAAAP